MHRRIKIVVLVSALLASPSALATIYFLACPSWSSATSAYLPSYETAVDVGLQNNTGFAAQCKPIKVSNCQPSASGFTQYTCTGTLTAACNNQTTTYGASGAGPPVAGNQIFSTSDANGKSRCAISSFETDPMKGKGRSEERRVGKECRL